MRFYQEITLLPNFEIDKNFLWFKLLTQIHLGLVKIQDGNRKSPIGVSFPEYSADKSDKKKFGVGSKIRLFAQNEDDLIKFDSTKWLSCFSDYVHITAIRQVPQKIDGYAIYNRHQPKVNKERLARRYATKHKVSYEVALEHYKDMGEKLVKYPFVKLKSLSSKNDFCLWIKKTTTNESNYQKFSTYGLNGISTVPEF